MHTHNLAPTIAHLEEQMRLSEMIFETFEPDSVDAFVAEERAKVASMREALAVLREAVRTSTRTAAVAAGKRLNPTRARVPDRYATPQQIDAILLQNERLRDDPTFGPLITRMRDLKCACCDDPAINLDQLLGGLMSIAGALVATQEFDWQVSSLSSCDSVMRRSADTFIPVFGTAPGAPTAQVIPFAKH